MTKKSLLHILIALTFFSENSFCQDISFGKVVVEIGDKEREDALVSVSLDGIPFDQANKELQLFEVNGKNKTKISSSIEQGYQARLWWVLSGVSKKSSKRSFELILTPLDTVKMEKAVPAVKVDKGADDLTITVNDKNVLSYRISPLPAPEGVSHLYQRSGFIHPLWSPRGEVLTRVQPPDHYHHVGIWNPWTHTEFEGRKIDFWNLKEGEGTVKTKKVALIESSDIMGRFKAIHEHVDLSAPDPSGSKIAINEEWEVRVWNVDPDSKIWLVDFLSSMNCDSGSPLTIEKYRYEGFGFRATEKWDDNTATLLTSLGKNKSDGNATRARWCDVNGVSDFGTSGILFMTHPSNFNYPEQLRIWPTGSNEGKENVFFNFNPAQDRDWKLLPGKNYVLKYRMMVYDGKITKEKAEQVWYDFVNPPKAELVLNK
ncbi:MAG: PmoA family protein [Cyclobacteriaceae bacterium]